MGGYGLFKEALQLVNKMYITEVDITEMCFFQSLMIMNLIFILAKLVGMISNLKELFTREKNKQISIR